MTNGETVQICIGAKILYANTSTNANFINWRFKNGNPATSNNFGSVTVQYNTAGVDTTFQTVISGGDTATLYILVSVSDQKPKASFTFSPNNDCGSVPIVFNSSGSVGNPLTYAWDFTDGSTSTNANPSYAFIKAIGTGGTQDYNVKLVVTNDKNCADSAYHLVTVKKIPDASIGNGRSPDVTFGPFNGEPTFRRCASLPYYDFKFTNASTTPNIITKYKIEWGEGSPDSMFTAWPVGTVITHIFPIGKSIMKVTAEGQNGCLGVKTYIVFLGTTPAGSLGNNGESSICATKSLAFPLHDYAGNAAGTTYSFSVNDGSVPIQYQHPPPDTITHVFNYGSCTFTSNNYTNAFVATLFIENPCGSSSAQIVPLYVSGKPRANLDIYPYYNICTNTAATISNASNFGGQITTTGGTGSECKNEGKQVWQITPATGYTITSGDTGNINGNLTNSSTWSSGTKTVDLLFTSPGVYKVKIFAGNDNCGIDTLTKTVCVRTAPQASFTMNTRTGCAPDTLVISNTSSAPACLGDTYKWDITYSDPLNCGNTSGYSFINGTSSASKDPVIRFAEAGRYIIKLTLTATGTFYTCAPGTYQDTFWVKTKPKATLNSVNAVCLGNLITPVAVVTNCYGNDPVAYNWTFANGTPGTSNQAVPGSIQYSTIGNYEIKLEASNECGVTIDTDSARITSTPAAVAGADVSVCSGRPVQIGSAGSRGITYKWTPGTGLSNTNIADPTATLAYNGMNSDTVYTFVVTAAAGANCSATDTIHIQVKKNPVVTVNPLVTQVCAGAAAELTAAGADSYLWTPLTGLNTSAGAVVTATPANTTTYTVTGTSSNGCAESAIATVTVIPYLPIEAGADTTVCNTSTAIQLSGTPAGGVWSGSSVTATGVFDARAAGVGVFKLYYTAGTGTCTQTDSLLVNVIDAPVANAGTDTLVCQSNTAIQLTASPSGGKWSNSTFVTAAGVFTPSAPGIYTLVYTFGGGSCKDDDTVVVTVNGGITNNTINGNQSICTGFSPAVITGQNASGGNGAPVYQWQSSSDNINWTDIAGANATDYAPGILTQTTWFRRVASTVLCSGPEANYSAAVKVTVNPNATAEFNPTTPTGCIPFRITPAIINLTSYNSSVSEYRWFVNGNYIGSGEAFPGYTMTNTGDSITVKLVAISAFGCKNDTAENGFTTVESPVPSFTQSITEGCGPLDVTFTNTTPNRDRYKYLWDFGQGQTSTDAQPGLINFPINPNFGDTVYTVTLKTSSACDTVISQHTVLVRAKPKALFTPDKSEGCSPMTVTFTNTSRGSNVNYVWDFNDRTPLVSTNNPVVQHLFTVSASTTFYVKLKGSNDCGSDSLIYAIVVKPNAIRIDFAVNGNQRYGCAPENISFINNTIGANNFNWDFGDGNTLVTSKGIDTVVHAYTTAGNFTIKLQASNGCSDTVDTEPITIGLKPTVGFTATPLISCITDNIRFANTSETGISNLWSFGDGTTSSNRDPVKAYNAAGSYRVRLTGSKVFPQGFSCSDSAFANVVIQDTLAGNFTVSDSVGSCTPFTVTFKNANAPSTSAAWTFGDGTTATGDSVTHTFTKPGSYNVVLISRGSSGCIFKATRQISVTAPFGTLAYTGGYTCIGNSVRFEVQAANTSRYTFVFGDGDSLNTTSPVISHQYLQPGNHLPYAYLLAGNCRIKVSTGDTIKADKTDAGFSIAAQMSCGATVIKFTDTSYSYYGIKNVQWNFGDGTASTLTAPSKTYTQSVKYYIQLAVTGKSGCTDTITKPVDITIRNYPGSSISGDSIACTGQPLPLSGLIQSKDSIASATWTFGNNTSATGRNVNPVYNTAGNYTVRLITNTIYGCADTVFKRIQVKTSPVINGGPDVRICLGQLVKLNATGTNEWQWTPVQGLSCNTCANPLAAPLATTAYVVKGTNPSGCSVTDTVLVEVAQPFKLTVSPDDSICIRSQTQLFAAGANTYLWEPATGLSSPTAPNPIAAPTVTTAYRVIGKDAFNCFADTGYVTVAVGAYPTVDLGTGALVVAGTTIPLNPIITNGPVKQYVWTPITDLSCYNCPRPIATINNNITYKLEVENIYGCKASDTISYRVTCEDALQVYIPNAFSPDGDNINDVLMVRGKGLAMVKYFRVFNRWGDLVFERNNFNANDARQGWDGKVRGVPANPDVYVYTAEVICTAGGVFVRKGNVTLFR